MGDRWRKGEGSWLPDVRREPSRGLRKGKYKRRTLDTIERIVVHHTGVGILNRFKRDRHKFGWEDPLECAVHVYARIMASSGHYVVGHDGTIVQCVPDDWAAWHAGYGGSRRSSRMADLFARLWYDRVDKRKEPRWFAWQGRRYEWWQDKWFNTHGLRSPTAWFPKLDVNGKTLGIELLAHRGAGPYPDSQIHGGPGGIGLVGLVKVLCKAYGIPIDRHHILTHSDVTPRARTTRGGRPYDPPPFKYDYDQVFGQLEAP